MQQMDALKKNDDSHDNEVEQYLTFLLGGKNYGLNILVIKEIIEFDELTDVPLMPNFMSGVINLRGSVVPVIDLSLRLSEHAIEKTKRTSIVILELSDNDLRIEVGVLVDMVNEVIDISKSSVEPPPALGSKIKTDFISGMAKINEKFLVLLNVEKLLSVDEISMVGNIRE